MEVARNGMVMNSRVRGSGEVFIIDHDNGARATNMLGRHFRWPTNYQPVLHMDRWIYAGDDPDTVPYATHNYSLAVQEGQSLLNVIVTDAPVSSKPEMLPECSGPGAPTP